MKRATFVTSVSLLVSHALGGGYAATCHDVALETGADSDHHYYLGAYCTDCSRLDSAWSTIDLGACLWNNNGQLEAGRGGQFWESCDPCELSGTVLFCACRGGPAPGYQATAFDLNTIIGNTCGKLVC